MSDRSKTISIGVFVVISILATIWLILFLKPTIGDGGKILKVRFSNISGINIGTRVTIAGKPVGAVIAIQEVKSARQDPTDELGRVFFYLLTLKVDSSVTVYNTDDITIATTGLMGEKSIAIVPKSPKKGVIPKDISEDIIFAQSIEPLENVIYQIGILSDKAQEAIGNIDVWFMENQDEISSAVQNFSNALKEISDIVGTANKEKLVTAVKESVDLISQNLYLIKDALQEVHDKDMVAKFNVILENFADASEYINKDGSELLVNLNQISKDIAKGQGTIGRLIKNDDFYLRVVSILGKIDTVMNDINHYGILFQYDKSWQRIRTKRANILQALNTPKEFKNYFQGEMDTVTTALSRISILLDKANDPQTKEKIMRSSPFQKDFSILLTQVEHLLDSLKLYNEQLIKTNP